jgi:transposase InsO family protein
MKAEELATQLFTHVFRLHGLPNDIVSDRGSLFTSAFWKEVSQALGVERHLSTAFHPETDGQTERVNAILEQYLRAYCNYQQDNWRKLLPIAELCYNNTESETTKTTPFYANYGYHPQVDAPLGRPQGDSDKRNNPYIDSLQELHEELRCEITHTQDGYAEQANKKRSPDPHLKPGDKVWLKRKNIRTTRPSSKLDYKQLGPFHILERIGNRAYKLDLPPSVKLHPVFHISLLEPTKPPDTAIPGHLQPEPPPTIIDGEQEWEVEEIVDSRTFRNNIQYRVKWLGFPDPDRTWYPASNFEHAQEELRQFHLRYPNKPKPTLS